MIIVFYIVVKDDYENILNNLAKCNKLFILISIMLIFAYYFMKALALYKIVKEHKKDIRFRQILKQTLITQFFNGITPFSTGGQPMQVYMLKNSGVKLSNATNIIIQDFLMYQLALISVGIFALVVNICFPFMKISVEIVTLIVIGFIINIAIGLGLLFISFSKRFNDFVGKLIIKLGSKVKIVKDKENTIKEWEVRLDEFHESAQIFKKKKKLFIECYVLNTFGLIAYYIIPFFVFISFGEEISIGITTVITSSAFVLIIGNFVPIPGGSGGIEYAFFLIFGSFLPDRLISSALIIWRFITYYLGILIGAIALGLYKGKEKEKESEA